MHRALVVGDAACVWNDIEEAKKLFTPDAVFAVNNMIIHYPEHLDFACTLHFGACQNWVGIIEAVRQREAAGRNRPETWGHLKRQGIDHHTAQWGGASGLFAVTVALEKGFDRIVLAGIPMTQEPHFYGIPWRTAGPYLRGWKRYLSKYGPFTRSMSGVTREMLGAPTSAWLTE